MLWSGFYMGIPIQGLMILQQEPYPLDHLPSYGGVLQQIGFPFGSNPLRLWHCDKFTFDSARAPEANGQPDPATLKGYVARHEFELYALHRPSLPVSKLGKVSWKLTAAVTVKTSVVEPCLPGSVQGEGRVLFSWGEFFKSCMKVRGFWVRGLQCFGLSWL